MLVYRSCWLRHLTWCKRRRPRRRPRGLERVPGARRCRILHPTNPRRTPPVKTRRRKKKPLPLQQGRKEEEDRPNRGGRRVKEGKDPPSGLLHRRHRGRRGEAAQGQAHSVIVSIRTLE